ncbi:EthD family reductase [Sphingomonas naphthae]|uniref:EthD family reductase n=1 Tax=Sphingomonas naphthae TaxID=1813468 RepID=A0ABY7TIZ4_9SPHN|nr:EthD family reductase [Sphingomonas naphthae]WCT73202.1 EthD family reductase [Sphingomonas naphthae]
MASLVVAYPNKEGGHFDAAYYLETHFPLCDRFWGPLGLIRSEAFPALDADQPYAMVAVLHFRDAAAIQAALGAGAEVFGDVANFTNLTPLPFLSDAG